MPSEAQIHANRANAQSSTGPRTDEGKAAVRLNALRHGLTSKIVVLPEEDPVAYNENLADLRSSWQPATAQEDAHVQSLAADFWRILCARRLETDALSGQQPLDLDRILRCGHRRWPRTARRGN